MRIKLLAVFIMAIAILLTQSFALGCNVCHSKNPRMVKMHKDLGSQSCFDCHGLGKIKPKEEQKKQMAGDSLCIRCHKK